MAIKDHIPARDIIMVELPDYTEKLLRSDGVLSINTLNEIKYHPTSGKVIAISPTLKKCQAQIGDTVYFEKLHWASAKDAAFDNEHDRDKGIYFEQEVYAFHENDRFYMCLPYRFLYMRKMISPVFILKDRGETVISGELEATTITMLNGYALCEPIENPINPLLKDCEYLNTQEHKEVVKDAMEFLAAIEIADLREENYALNEVKILQVPLPEFIDDEYGIPAKKLLEMLNQTGYLLYQQRLIEVCWLQPGDTVYTLPNCDIPLVESINGNENSFIIEIENIIAKLMAQKYIAAPNRIVIEIISQDTEENEVLKIDSEFAKYQTAKVISAGTGVECKEGDTIVFPRNAGKKSRLPILPGSTIQYEVIGKDDYFTTIIEQ